MTPEAAQFLKKSRDDLNDARKIASIGLAHVAARSAYYAAFHAAEATLPICWGLSGSAPCTRDAVGQREDAGVFRRPTVYGTLESAPATRGHAYLSVASLLRVEDAAPVSVKYFVSSPSATVGMHVGVQE